MYTMIGSPHKHIGSFPHNDKICDSSLEGYYNIDKRQNGLKFVVLLVKRIIIFTSTYIVLQILFLVIQIEIQAQNHALCSPQCPPPHTDFNSRISQSLAQTAFIKFARGAIQKFTSGPLPGLIPENKIIVTLVWFVIKNKRFHNGTGPPPFPATIEKSSDKFF